MKPISRIKNSLPHMCRSSRFVCGVLLGILVIEVVVFHIFLLYTYIKFKDNFTPIYDPSKHTLIEQLGVNKFARNLIFSAKYGGLSSILRDTVERLYITYPKGSSNISLATFRLDTSHSGEFLYLYRRILSRKQFPYPKLIVDIGANDGFLSSNSFNFIQHGWNGILVEPLTEQLNLARYQLTRYVDEYNDKNQYVQYVEAVLGTQDGGVKLVVSPDLASMESHVLNDDDYDDNPRRTRMVRGMSVKTFIQEYDVPKYFGILSIDAEGIGNKILHDFIDMDCRPAYIIYEDLHEKQEETAHETIQYLISVGYKFLSHRGWNLLFEYTKR